MTVTLRKPDSEEYKKFSEEVKRRAQDDYNNFTYGEEEVSQHHALFSKIELIMRAAVFELIQGQCPCLLDIY